MPVKDQLITKRFSLYHGDCCEVLPDLPDDSIGYSVFSPPFANLYAYSDDDADMGNVESKEVFFDHFQFLIKQLWRIIQPGRNVSIHCMDMPRFKRDGDEISIYDFPADLVRHMESEGFIYHSRVVIWKDPLIAATRTKAIGLAHKQIVKDSTICRMGLPDYVLTFRKPGDNLIPVQHPKGLTEYHGSRQVPRDLSQYEGWEDDPKVNKRSHWIWQQYASPVWFDIRQTVVLPFRDAREGDDQKHICPLQLDVIERCIELWTMKGDIVLTPYMGVGSEVYVAVKNSRRAVGVELKGTYYRQAIENLRALKNKKRKGFSG